MDDLRIDLSASEFATSDIHVRYASKVYYDYLLRVVQNEAWSCPNAIVGHVSRKSYALTAARLFGALNCHLALRSRSGVKRKMRSWMRVACRYNFDL